MSGIKPIIIGLLLVALFSYALIIGGSNFIIQNSDTTLDDPTLINFTNTLSEVMENNSDSARQSNDAFTNSSITTTTSIPYVDSIGGIWKSAKKYPVMIYDVTMGLVFTKLLSDNAKTVIISVLGAILTLSILFAAWKLIATGESER